MNNEKLMNSPIDHVGDYKYIVILGKDKKSYVPQPNNKGVYYWTEITMKNDVNDFYKQIPYNKLPKYEIKFTKQLDMIKEDLLKNYIYMVQIYWKECYSNHKYAEYITYEKKVPDILKNNNIIIDLKKIKKLLSILYYTDYDLYWALRKGILIITHNILDKDITFVKNILQKHFGKTIKYLITPTHIEIKLNRIRK